MQARTTAPRQSPIASRIFPGFALAASLLAAGVARGQTPPRWTELDVARLAASRSPERPVASAAEALGRALEGAPGLLPNPSVGWEREQVFAPGAAQDVVRVTWPLDPSSRRSARVGLARAATSSVRADAAAARAEWLGHALLAFHEALVARERADLARSELAALDESARVVRSREVGGSAAGYDTVRLELEAELVRSRVAEAELDARLARARLFALVPHRSSSEPTLAWSSDVIRPPPLPELLERALVRRAELRELRRVRSLAREASRRADGGWLPMVTLSAGLDLAHERATSAGYAASVSVELPVFSRGQDVAEEARAGARLAAARVEALQARIRAEVTQARAELVAASEELVRFERETAARADVLRVAIESGYREGHRSVVELLDARRVRFEIEARAVELRARARRAEIALRRASGELQ